MIRLRTLAPAKVNLVLRVGPRRPDGFHDIESLMVPLDLADEVRVSVDPERPGPVTCRCPGRPELDGPDNLAARAAAALLRRLGLAAAVEIVVEKRIPVTAGLGGGSSDAAAVLRCLSAALGRPGRSSLREVALSVGSDVPFFLGSGPAWARGRGERLRAARVTRRNLLLAYPTDPALAIRAGEAYAWLDEARGGRHPVRRGAPRATLPENDLMEPCLEHRPELRTLAGWLVECGATAPIMSGSGPTMFGSYREFARAGGAARRLGERRLGRGGLEVIVARTLSRMPGVSPWKSPRSASFRSRRTSSRRT